MPSRNRQASTNLPHGTHAWSQNKLEEVVRLYQSILEGVTVEHQGGQNLDLKHLKHSQRDAPSCALQEHTIRLMGSAIGPRTSWKR